MTRRFAKWSLAVLLVLSATVPAVAAQRGGRGGFAGAPGRMAPAAVRGQGAPAMRPPAVRPPISSSGSRFEMRQNRHVVVAPPYWGYYGGYYSGLYSPYPYVTGPSYYPDLPYSSSTAQTSYVVTDRSASEVELSNQVEQLTREVERLRQEQAEASQREAAARRALEPPPVPITLVFRDGRRQNIQSYAIVKDTLWVLDERMSTKINLNELDLVATQQANLGRVLLLPAPVK